MSEFRTDFRVKLIYPDEQAKFEASEERRRERFWAPIIEASSRDEKYEGPDEYAYESAIRRNLPERLRSKLSDIFLVRGDRGEILGNPIPIPIVFTVTTIRYSSMEIGLGIEPLSKFVELFDKNFDYFRAAIEGFVPEAIEDVILSPVDMSRSTARRSVVNRLQHSIAFEPHLISAFVSSCPDVKSNTEPAARELTSADKAKWAWIAANTSLLVPTALAAIYLYVAHQDMKDTEKLRPDEFHKIIDQQMKMLNTCGTLLTQAGDRSKPAASIAKPAESDGSAAAGGK